MHWVIKFVKILINNTIEDLRGNCFYRYRKPISSNLISQLSFASV